ncbi:MAG: hypothetical protein LBJ43_04210 [Propionibacteriaceae bacterium]|jgi:hypothetical protein|nr:hypothetical protein [Propionibacteriaceae bacterium]
MTKRWYSLLLAPLALLLTGCINMTQSVAINSDNDIQIAVDVSVSKQIAQMLGTNDLCTVSNTQIAIPSGVNVMPYSTSDSIGCRYSYTTDLAGVNNSGSGLTLTHSNGEYRFVLRLNIDALNINIMGDTTDMFSALMVSVQFPGTVITHNLSSTVSGNTVTWNKISDILSAEGLQASSSDTASFPTVAVIAAVTSIAVAGVTFFFGFRFFKKRKAAAEQAAYYQQYAATQQFYSPGYPDSPYNVNQTYENPMPHPTVPATPYGTPATPYGTPAPTTPYGTPPVINPDEIPFPDPLPASESASQLLSGNSAQPLTANNPHPTQPLPEGYFNPQAGDGNDGLGTGLGGSAPGV